MVLKRGKWTIFIALITVLFLSACGDNDGTEKSGDFTFTPIGSAIDKHAVWYQVDGDEYEPTRNSDINDVYVFEKGTVKVYPAHPANLVIEDIVELSDDEVLEVIRENTEDFEEPEAQEYTLDIWLDDLGQNTQYINLETARKTLFSFSEFTTFETIFDIPFSGLKSHDDQEDLIITRVKDSSILFKLDDPDTKNKKVTVEEGPDKELREELAKEAEEERRIKEEERLAKEEEQKAQDIEDGVFDTAEAEELYFMSCAACHGDDLSGSAGPSLETVGNHLSKDEIVDIIENGKGAMPGGLLNGYEAEEVTLWLSTLK